VAATELYDAKAGTYTIEGKTLDSAGMVDFLREPRQRAPDRVDRGRLLRGRLEGLEADQREDRRQGAARRRRPVRHEFRAARAAASPKAWPTASS